MSKRASPIRDLSIVALIGIGVGVYVHLNRTPETPPVPDTAQVTQVASGTKVDDVRKTVAKPDPKKPYDPSEQILGDLLRDKKTQRAATALKAVLQAKDVRFIPVFVDLLAMTQRKRANGLMGPTIIAALQRLSKQSFMKWADWYLFVARSKGLEPPPDYPPWKGVLYGRADRRYVRVLAPKVPMRIRRAEITWSGRGIGVIPPLHQPPVVTTKDAWLAAGDLVVGIVVGGQPRAYPLRVLDAHETVNDVVNKIPLTITLDALCGAARVLRANLGVERQRFTNSGLIHRGNKLLLGHDGALWQQLTAQAVTGRRAQPDAKPVALTQVPSVITTWARWRTRHPSTTVLSDQLSPRRNYTTGFQYGEYYAHDSIYYPAFPQKPLLPNKTWVVGVEHRGVAAAFTLDPLLAKKVDNVAVGEAAVVLVAPHGKHELDGTTARKKKVRYRFGAEVRAYLRTNHTFKPTAKPDVLEDEVGKTWVAKEDALHGPGGSKLARVPLDVLYWFAWAGFHPETTLLPTPK